MGMRIAAPKGAISSTACGCDSRRRLVNAVTTIVVNIQHVIESVGFHPQLGAVTTIVVANPACGGDSRRRLVNAVTTIVIAAPKPNGPRDTVRHPS